jgi:cytochrome c oxidase subunit 2
VGSTSSSSTGSRRRRTLVLTLVLGATLLAVSSCSADTELGRLGVPSPVSVEGDATLAFWQDSWIAAWIVGGIVWGLMFFAMIAFRRRPGDGLPKQMKYNLPIEILYTVTPIMVVAVMFTFTARNTEDLTRLTNDTQHTVGVVGSKWVWTFNYVQENTYDIGTPDSPATLWLPVNEKVRFQLTSPDVIHDFWVPAFLFKMDVIPGRLNQFELTPNVTGTFVGKCAELCGTDHSRMLFNVKIVSVAEYQAHIASLKARGQIGQLDTGRVVTTGVEQ